MSKLSLDTCTESPCTDVIFSWTIRKTLVPTLSTTKQSLSAALRSLGLRSESERERETDFVCGPISERDSIVTEQALFEYKFLWKRCPRAPCHCHLNSRRDYERKNVQQWTATRSDESELGNKFPTGAKARQEAPPLLVLRNWKPWPPRCHSKSSDHFSCEANWAYNLSYLVISFLI